MGLHATLVMWIVTSTLARSIHAISFFMLYAIVFPRVVLAKSEPGNLQQSIFCASGFYGGRYPGREKGQYRNCKKCPCRIRFPPYIVTLAVATSPLPIFKFRVGRNDGSSTLFTETTSSWQRECTAVQRKKSGWSLSIYGRRGGGLYTPRCSPAACCSDMRRFTTRFIAFSELQYTRTEYLCFVFVQYFHSTQYKVAGVSLPSMPRPSQTFIMSHLLLLFRFSF
jgi:hypothetical protein